MTTSNKKIVLSRNLEKRGHKNEWTAQIAENDIKGIGKTRADAIDSLVRANIKDFGIVEWVEDDPESGTPITEWKSP